MRTVIVAGSICGVTVAGSHSFLRLDRAELSGTTMIVRATPAEVREHRRRSRDVPLGYLYERSSDADPDSDIVLAAGHYDQTNLVWSFSGELTGIIGLTEPYPTDEPATHHGPA
jgi:hypothetical protein